MWRACWNDILHLARMVHHNEEPGFGNGRMHWRGKQWWLKNAARAGANSSQLLIETFLFKSNHTQKLIPLQHRRAYCTEHGNKKFFLFCHSDIVTKPMANACALMGHLLGAGSLAGNEKRAQQWLETMYVSFPIPSRLTSIQFNK